MPKSLRVGLNLIHYAMKKLLLVSLTLLLAVSTFGQMKFGAKAGLNLANMSTDASGVSPKMIVGFNIGGILELSLSDNIAIQPGIFYSAKGSKSDLDFGFMTGTGTAKLSYIEVPINVLYKLGSGDMKFVPFIGPYLGYGIGGKIKMEAGGQSQEEDVKFGSGDTDDFKALDLGLNVGIGVEMGNLLISAQYGLGLANINPTSDNTVKNNVIGISVGYLFGGK